MATRSRRSEPQHKKQQPPERTSYGPPEWRKAWSRTADLGYPGYSPPRSDHDAEDMSETLVQNGFKGRSLLNTAGLETFNAHNLIHDGFAKHGQIHLHMLGQLMHDVAARRAESRPQVGPSTYRLPPKVTVQESKRDAWIADLADNQVPLSKLANSPTPHPFKGHDLLDMLYKNSVPIDRALWYVRVLGAHETHVMRMRPNFDPAQYSIDWTNIVTSHLKKQIGEILLPTPLRPGLTIRQTFQGVLNDPDGRAKWTSRFSYSLDLLRVFVSEGLVDRATFMAWLASMMLGSNMAQLEFVIHMAEDYLDLVMENRSFLAPFIEACLVRLAEIDTNPLNEHLTGTVTDLGTFIQRGLLTRPDCFIHPRLWSTYGNLLRTILVDKPEASATAISLRPQHAQEICAALKVEYEKISMRIDALLFRTLPPREARSLRSTLASIKLLNSISAPTHLADLDFFAASEPFSIDSFRTKLHTLLTWAATSQCGNHKHYAAATILSLWRKHHDGTNVKLSQPMQQTRRSEDILQVELMDWLDTSEIAMDRSRHGDNIAKLYGELIRKRLFDFADLLRKIVAHGNKVSEAVNINRREYARMIPLGESSGSLRTARSAALYGKSGQHSHEEVEEMELRIKLVQALPELFPEWELEEQEVTPGELDSGRRSPASTSNASPYLLSEVGHRWLIPAVWKHVKSNKDSDPIRPHVFCYVSYSLDSHLCHNALLELCLYLLLNSGSSEILRVAIDSLRIHLDIWASMNVIDEVVKTLTGHLAVLEAGGTPAMPLSLFLREVSTVRQASDASGTYNDSSSNMEDTPMNEQIFVVPEITGLVVSPLPETGLADLLRERYAAQLKWTYIIWDSIIFALDRSQDLPLEEAVLRFSRLLEETGVELSLSLELESRRWFQGRGHRLLSFLDERIWSAIESILIRSVISGTLSTSTVLFGLVFPIWSRSLDDSAPPLVVPVRYATGMARRLLIVDGPLPFQVQDSDAAALLEAQRLLGQHSLIHTRQDTIRFFAAIADLVMLEDRKGMPDSERELCTSLRTLVSRSSTFRVLAMRHIEDVRTIFCRSTSIDVTGAASEDKLVETLAMLITPPSELSGNLSSSQLLGTLDIQAILPLMTPWNFSTAMIELQVSFKRLTLALASETERAQAQQAMDAFALGFFEHTLDAQQTDLVADVLRGMDGVLAERFFDSGFKRLAQLLAELNESNDAPRTNDFLRSAGEVLRLLASVLQPLRASGSIPVLGYDVQRDFTAQLEHCLKALSATLLNANHEDNDSSLHRLLERIMLVLRLVQFHAGFPSKEPFPIPAASRMGLLVRLLADMFTQSSFDVDPVIVAALLDTIAHMLSLESPKVGTSNLPTSKQSLDIDYTEVLGKLPNKIAKRLEFLLPFKWRDPRVKGLFMARRVAPNSNRLILGDPVQARPWDWTKYAAVSSPTLDNKATTSPMSPPSTLPNNTSISLEHFIVRTTGERARSRIPVKIDRVEAELRNTYDRFHSESMYERDWRDGRVGWKAGDSETGKPSDDANTHTPASAVSAASPVEVVRSPLTVSAAGRSSAPESPVSATTSSSHTGGGRAPKAQASSLRNEIRLHSGGESDPCGESAIGVGRRQKRKADTSDMDNFSATSSSSHPSQISNPSPSLTRANAGPSTARGASSSAAGPSATSAVGGPRLPQRPTAPSIQAGQARHPLPPKPQFSNANSAITLTATSTTQTQPRGATMLNIGSGSDAGATKRKREATVGSSGPVTSPITALDPKKRRTAPAE